MHYDFLNLQYMESGHFEFIIDQSEKRKKRHQRLRASILPHRPISSHDVYYTCWTI